MIKPKFATIEKALVHTPRFNVLGRVKQVVGLVVESNGPVAKLGEVCTIEHTPGKEKVFAEVVGFKGDNVVLMPLGDMTGVQSGSLVESTGECLSVPVGASLLGRVINGLGQPIDGKGPLRTEKTYPIVAQPPNALTRKLINKPFETGVRALDSVLTIGVGQRMGIFAGSGVGKSTLLGMIARNGSADVNVIALVGERGRELREFIENDLGPDGMKKSVVVCATSDESALVRIKAAMTATSIAEYFRDHGQNVVLMMDSVTRFAMAQREVGLAVGEPPSTKGYTPSVFALLPKLLERAGCGPKGAITGIYTVLVDGDDTSEPIADATRSILDGHVVLSRKLAMRSHYPPIDVMASVSRVMPMVVAQSQVKSANALRELIAAYYDVEDMVSVGAYKHGSQPKSDKAIDKWDAINAFLRQGVHDATPLKESAAVLERIVNG